MAMDELAGFGPVTDIKPVTPQTSLLRSRAQTTYSFSDEEYTFMIGLSKYKVRIGTETETKKSKMGVRNKMYKTKNIDNDGKFENEIEDFLNDGETIPLVQSEFENSNIQTKDLTTRTQNKWYRRKDASATTFNSQTSLALGTSILQRLISEHQTQAKSIYDIIGIYNQGDADTRYQLPEFGEKEIINSANATLTILSTVNLSPHASINFLTNVRFFNILIYFKDVNVDLDADVRIPQTAIPILGNTLKDLLIYNKAWIITDGAKQPIANLLGEALSKAEIMDKELTKSLRKRLTLTGMILKRTNEGLDRRRDPPALQKEINPSKIYTILSNEQKWINDVINPYSGLTLWIMLKDLVLAEDSQVIKEKIIWLMSQKLKIPAVTISLEPPEVDSEYTLHQRSYKSDKIRVEIMDPYRKGTEKWTRVLKVNRKIPTLKDTILQAADDYFDYFADNPDISFKDWNTISPAIFRNSNFSVKKQLDKLHLKNDDDKIKGKLINRTIRYVLFFGKREVVQTLFNHVNYQDLIISQRASIILETFVKSSEEVFLFSRLMIAVKGNSKAKMNNYITLNISLKAVLVKIFGIGFLWEIPSLPENDEDNLANTNEDITNNNNNNNNKMKKNEEKEEKEKEEKNEQIKKSHKDFFSEYIMLWALLCQKFDVAELFLEYSGTHDQFLGGSIFDTKKGLYQIGNALAASKILKGISQILKGDTSITKEDHQVLKDQAMKYESRATGLLSEALRSGANLESIYALSLPFWGGITLISLAKLVASTAFFSERGIQAYVSNKWNGYYSEIEGQRENKGNSNVKHETRRHMKRIFQHKESFLFVVNRFTSPKNTFILHVMVYTLFLLMLTLLLCFFWLNIDARNALIIIYIIYVSTNQLGEIQQYLGTLGEKFHGRRNKGTKIWLRTFKSALIDYLSSFWNLLDIFIFVLFLASIFIYYFVDHFTQPAMPEETFHNVSPLTYVRLLFGIISSLFFVRYFQYLLVFKGLGPLVYTCVFAFFRMLYFLVIIVLVVLCCGIAEVTLTDLSQIDEAESLAIFFTFPYFQIFGEYFFENLEEQSYAFANLSDADLNIFGSAENFWVRSLFLSYIVVMVWILIANVLLLNLMIAYFSKIYDDVAKNATSIYLANFIEIVDEYFTKPFLPPPFNVITYAFRIVVWCVNLKIKKSDDNVKGGKMSQLKKKPFKLDFVYFGWHNEESFCDEFWKKINEDRKLMVATDENQFNTIQGILIYEKY